MEKKPLRRNENIAKLSRDHHASLMFCWKIRQGIRLNVATDRMTRYVEYFLKHHLLPHFKEEEEILFATVSDIQVQKAINDHIEIKRSANEIISSTKDDLQNEVAALADLVDAHVRFEERVLFPFLEKELSEEQLQNIGKQISDELVKDNFEDDFWVKKEI